MKLLNGIYFLFVIFLFACNDNEQKLKESQHKIDSLTQKRYTDSILLENAKLKDSITLPQHTSLTNKYNQLKQSVFLVYADKSDATSQGSAFLINQAKGICISNFHVFKDAVDAYVIDYNGNNHAVKNILFSDENTDYIIFTVEGAQQFPALHFATQKLEVGDDCFAIGNPRGLQQTLSTGIVSSYRDDDNQIQTTTSFTHGSSGGPLFNSNGEVIGITTSIYEGEGNLNFAINSLKLPIQKYLDNSTSNGNNGTALGSCAVPTIIADFIKAEELRDFNRITNCFTTPLEQYWDLYYPTNEQLQKVYTSRWNKMKNASNQIVSCKKINSTTYELTINFSFFSLKDNITKTVNNTLVRYEISNNKISKVYGVK